MIAGKDRDQRFLNHVVLADNDLAGFVARLREELTKRESDLARVRQEAERLRADLERLKQIDLQLERRK